jgi:RNA polymerase sigma-70 factor (sigma-E family)
VGVKTTSRARDELVRDLFKAHYEPLCRLAFLILRDSQMAEEAVMDAFLKVFGWWRRVGSMNRPDLYLRRIVVNGCSSRLRRRAVEARARAVVPAPEGPNWEEGRLDTARLVRDAIEHLPRRQRLCVVLRYFEDLSEAEMADVLQVSAGTIKSQLSKAREHLKSVLIAQELRGENRG